MLPGNLVPWTRGVVGPSQAPLPHEYKECEEEGQQGSGPCHLPVGKVGLFTLSPSPWPPDGQTRYLQSLWRGAGGLRSGLLPWNLQFLLTVMDQLSLRELLAALVKFSRGKGLGYQVPLSKRSLRCLFQFCFSSTPAFDLCGSRPARGQGPLKATQHPVGKPAAALLHLNLPPALWGHTLLALHSAS